MSDSTKTILEQFRKLVCQNIILRYADYYGQISHIRYNAQDLALTSGSVVLNLNWQEICSQLQKEEAETKAWMKTPTRPRPKTQITDTIRSVAVLCKITLQQARFQIQEYVQRCTCTIRFEKIEHAFRAGNIFYVARRLVTDRELIEKKILPEGIRGEDLLRALDYYQTRWFEFIRAEEKEVGEMEAMHYVKTPWAVSYLGS